MTITRDHLKSYIERIEKLEEEKKAISEDIKDIYAEAKGNGFDPAAIKAVVRDRKQDPVKKRALEEMVELYINTLG